MANKLTDEEMNKLEAANPPSKKFISDEEMNKIESSWGRDAALLTAKALPTIGTMAGGILGAPLAPPYGSIAGAGLLGGAGSMAERAIKGYLGEPIGDPMKDMAAAAVEGALAETGGQIAGKAIGWGLEKGGEALYKSGLPNMAKMAVDDIKDMLFKMKVVGNKQQVADALQGVIDTHMGIVDDLARQATEAGGKVKMRDAMKPALDMAAQIEKDNNLELMPLAKSIRNRAGKYIAQDNVLQTSIESGSLPIQGENIPVRGFLGEQVGTKFVPKSEIPISWTEVAAEPGYSPEQALAIKRSMGAGLTGKQWALNKGNPAWVNAEKLFTGGVKGAIENTIGQTLGKEAEEAFIANNLAAGKLIDYQKFITPMANQAAPGLTATEAMAIGVQPKAAIPYYIAKKALEKAPLKYGMKAYEMGNSLQASPWKVSVPVSGAAMGGMQFMNQFLIPQDYGKTEMPSTEPSKLEIGKQISEQAIRSGMPPYMVDKQIKQTPILSNTEKAQIRRSLTEGQ